MKCCFYMERRKEKKPRMYYAVAAGRKTGVFSTWEEAKAQVNGFEGARFKKFPSHADAETFVKGGGSLILGQFGIVPESIIPVHEKPKESPHTADALVCFTDGACTGNGRAHAKAGYAAVFPNHPELTFAGALEGDHKTNNRAEYSALLVGLQQALKVDPLCTRTLIVYTDSKLLLQSVTQWMKNWKRNGWRKADGSPVLNQDLLEALDALLVRRKVEMHHVRAHTGGTDWMSRWNDQADRMASQAAQ
jgi:ribonuclease HI